MKRKIGIINVNLEYEIPENEDQDEYIENVELPKEYIEDSFLVVEFLNSVICDSCGCECKEEYVETIDNKELCYGCDSKRLELNQ